MTPTLQRSFSRHTEDIRPCEFRLGAAANANGSALAIFGNTKVLCTATIDKEVPRFQSEKGQGWLTAEYGMLPCATAVRSSRERTMSNGRTKEIQRLIGRSLRACLDLTALAGYRIIIDCDVLQADGGTRTASICGAWLALVQACTSLYSSGELSQWPVVQQIAAISVGQFQDTVIVDLDYSEDSRAQVDSNVVMNSQGEFIEIQGTAEGKAFSRSQLEQMLDYAQQAISKILSLQRQTLADSHITWPPV
ncbi:MAG: ribonuclease PH [bacterium]|nr:ribonuclease PH [bacterium]